MASAILPENLRIVRRRQCLVDFSSSNQTRPSVLDNNLRGDLWIGFEQDSLTLFLGKQRLVTLAGTRLDCMSMNARLQELRQGKPRRKCRG